MSKTEIHVHEYVTIPVELMKKFYEVLHDVQVELRRHECKYPRMMSDKCIQCDLQGELGSLLFRLHEWTDK